MKKFLSVIILVALIFSFSACDSESSENTISYYDAESFEAALNNGTKVKGKIVQFCVEEYAPDSILGINCHAGEHLNFIFKNELDVKMGDTIIVRITKEPSKVFLIDSWEVPCEFIEVVAEKQEDAPNDEPTTESSKAPSTPPSTVPPTEPQNKAGAPDVWFNLLEKHYEVVRKQFEDAGFTNITCVAREIDYNENYVFEGSVFNIAIGEDGKICTFEKGEQWEKDIKIRIDYRVKPTKPSSKYEKAFIRDLSNYDLYYMFDTDTNTVVFFGTNDNYIERGTYTGNFSTGITITWSHGEWTEKFTYKSGNTATLIDGSGWDWEYKVCNVEKAQQVLDSLE